MYQLVVSNGLEELINRHNQRFNPPSLWGEDRFYILQNKSMEHWLKLNLTDHWGITAGLRFEFPDNSIRFFLENSPLAQRLQGDRALLYMDDLKILLFKHLQGILEEGTSFPEIVEYCQLQQDSPSSVLLYKMANQIAGLFHHYAMNASPLIEAWEEDRNYLSPQHPLYETEQWQRRLWRRVFSDRYMHLGQLIRRVLKSQQPYDGPSVSVVLFGSVFLSQTGFEFFRYLSEQMEVTHFLLTPAEPGESGFSHPLLGEWASLIEGFWSLVRKEEISVEKAFVQKDSPWGMEGVHQDFLANSGVPSGVFEVHSFSSPMREVEGLKDQILALIEEGYKPEDIGVLAPDIRNYGAFIEGVFSSSQSGPSIPFNMIDLSLGAESPFIQASIELVALMTSRFSRQDLYQFFKNPCVLHRLGIDSSLLEEWLEFQEETNIRWGSDGPFRQQQGAGGEGMGTYQRGFSRFLAGLALPGEEYGGLLPYNHKSLTLSREMGKLIQAHNRLFEVSRRWQKKTQPLEGWVLEFEELFLSFTGERPDTPEDKVDRRTFRDVLRKLNALTDSLEADPDFDSQMDFALFQHLLQEVLQETSGGKGQYLTGGVTCSNLKPLRAIPFKIIFLLGMDEGVFPAEESPLSFDLRDVVPRVMNMDQKNTDLYALVETILSARDKIFLFYQGVNPVSGEEVPPSLMVEQLLEYRGDREIHLHPLQGFHSSYYEGGALFTYNPNGFLSGRKEEESLIYQGRGSEEDEEALSLYNLCQFLKDPLGHHIKRVHNMDLREELLLEELTEDPRSLDRNHRLRLIETGLQGHPLEELFHRAYLEGALPMDLPGKGEAFLIQERFNLYQEQLKSLGRDKLGEPVLLQLTEATKEEGDLPPLVLDLEEQRVVLKGNLRSIYAHQGGHLYWKPLETSSVWQYHFLEGFLYRLILDSHPEYQNQPLMVGGSTRDKGYGVTWEGDSLVHLTLLVRLYLDNLKKPLPLTYPLIKGLAKEASRGTEPSESLYLEKYQELEDRLLLDWLHPAGPPPWDPRIKDLFSIAYSWKPEEIKR